MAEISTLNGYKIKDKKAIRFYNSIADMVADTSLKEGMHAKTKGYHTSGDGGHAEYTIVNDNTLIADGGSVHDLDNGLKATLIVENDTINSIQVGCKVNDNTFDNGIILNKALNYCNNNHYNFLFLKGDYYITTPVVINEKLFSIKISGMAYNGGYGTRLVYNGEGYCLTLAKGGLRYTIEKIEIECNNTSSGINCDGVINTVINFKNYLKDITIQHAIIGMRVVSSTYTFIDNYSFGGSSNTEIGLLIEGYEFTYINNTSIDGYSNTDSNSIALKLDGGLNYYINNVDLCNFGLGKAIYLTTVSSELYTCYFNNINIIRCDGGVYFDPINRHITSVEFNNILFALSGINENSHYFYSVKNDSYYAQNIKIDNVTIRNLASTKLPNYLFEQNTGGVVRLSISVKDVYNAPTKTLGIKGNTYDNYTYKIYCIKQQCGKYFTAVENQRTYTFEIDYPKMENIPYIIINVRNNKDYVVNNLRYDDTTGKLKIDIIFDTAPSNNFQMFYSVMESGQNQ